jgi:predicted phage terminase large subunit-like protein
MGAAAQADFAAWRKDPPRSKQLIEVARGEVQEAWVPHPGPQRMALACTADEALLGGAAGGGKSTIILVRALKYTSHSNYRALLLRRTYGELEKSLIDESHKLYPRLANPPEWNGGKYRWTFRSRGGSNGARISFDHVEHERHIERFKSAAFQFIALDELTTFTRAMWVYIRRSLRSADGIPCQLLAGTNPDGPGQEWVRSYFAPWIYKPGERTDEYSGPYAKPGQKLWFIRGEDDEDVVVPKGTRHAMSRTYIPARLEDNPSLMENDPDYESRLMQLDRPTREAQRWGNWFARADDGDLFDRDWFEIVPRGPESLAVARVRWWDRAATEGEKKAKKNDPTKASGPDWTAGVLLAKDMFGICYVEDVERFQGAPHKVEKRIAEVAAADKKRYGHVTIVLAEDPGSSGKAEISHYMRSVLNEHEARAIRETGDKVTRAKPVSAQAEQGLVKVVKGPWNEVFLREVHVFPLGKKDQVDGLSGAYSVIAPIQGGLTAGTAGAYEAGKTGGF